MKSRTAFAAGCIASLVLAAGLGAGAADSQGGTLTAAQAESAAVRQARATIEKLMSMSYRRFTSVDGAGVAWTDPISGIARAASLKAPGFNYALAGFETVSLSVGGTVPGATAQAAFDVTEVVGDGLSLYVGICDLPCTGQKKVSWRTVSSRGQFTHSAGPVNLVAGKQYVVRAAIYADASGPVSQLTGGAARITAIKWQL